MRYLVKARVQTAVHVERLQVVEAPDAKVTVSNWIEADAAGQAHRGLMFDVVLEAADLDEALRISLARANFVLTLFSFAMAAGSTRIELLIAYWRGEDDWCEVAQFERLPLGPFVRRILDPARLLALVPQLDSLPEGAGERVLRAMAWYQRSAEEENPLDQFAAVWIGLETLNPLLKKRAGLAEEEPVRSCLKCGAAVEMAPTSAGIRDVLTRHRDESLWRRANRRRVAILHGTEPFSELHADLAALADATRAALRRGVLDLLSLEGDDRVTFDHQPISVPLAHQATVRYAFRPLTLDSIRVGQGYPRLKLRRVEGARFRGSDGRTNEKAATEWEPNDFSGEWRFHSVALATFGDPEDEAASTTIERVTFGQNPRL